VVWIWRTSAPANGEFLPILLIATLPGWVGKLMSLPTLDSGGARPMPIDAKRVPNARARLRASGLLRHASRNRMFALAFASMTSLERDGPLSSFN
jgi:hypothetical protein